jgi:hypothetical protein
VGSRHNIPLNANRKNLIFPVIVYGIRLAIPIVLQSVPLAKEVMGHAIIAQKLLENP